MSNSNEVRISYIKQSTLGAIPAGSLQTINVASESLKGTLSTTQSALMSDTGNIPDLLRTGFSADGGINGELGHEFYDDFIVGAFRSALETPISLSGITFSIAAGGSPITLDDSGAGLGSIKPNDVIMVQGFTDANNNGAYHVGANVAAGSIDITQIDPTKTVTTEAAGDTVTITTTRMENANTNSFFAIEKYFVDMSSQFMEYLDMHVDTMNLEFGAGAVPTINFTFKGTDHPAITSTIGTGYTAASTNDVINTENGYIGTLLGNDGAVLSSATGCVTKVSISITNSIRVEEGLNCTTIGKGDFDCKVNFDIVFLDQTYYKIFQNDGYTSLSLAAVDGSNQGFGFTFPKIKYTDATVQASGRNSTVIGSYQGQALKTTVGSDTYTAIINKLG